MPRPCCCKTGGVVCLTIFVSKLTKIKYVECPNGLVFPEIHPPSVNGQTVLDIVNSSYVFRAGSNQFAALDEILAGRVRVRRKKTTMLTLSL